MDDGALSQELIDQMLNGQLGSNEETEAWEDSAATTQPAVEEDPLAEVMAGSLSAPAAAPAPAYAQAPTAVHPVQFMPLTPDSLTNDSPGSMDLLLDVSLEVSVDLGHSQMTIREVLGLRNGSVVELDKLAGEPVDVSVNGTLIARGEVVVVDEKFGVRITEVVSRAKRLASIA
jgi:flagellar motor switch protein FliN/FliY